MPEGSEFVVATVSSKDKTLFRVQGAMHELLHEKDWRDSANRYVDWIVKHTTV